MFGILELPSDLHVAVLSHLDFTERYDTLDVQAANYLIQKLGPQRQILPALLQAEGSTSMQRLGSPGSRQQLALGRLCHNRDRERFQKQAAARLIQGEQSFQSQLLAFPHLHLIIDMHIVPRF